MKQIKLRKINSIKYCWNCKEFVKIRMKDLNGYCPNENCKTEEGFNIKLYTIDNSKKSK